MDTFGSRTSNRRPTSVADDRLVRTAQSPVREDSSARYAAPALPGLHDLPRLPVSRATEAHSPLTQRLSEARRPGPPDYWLILTIVALAVMGLVMVYSASQYAMPGDPGYWFRHQLVWALLGSGALIGTLSVDYRRWRMVALPGLLLALLLLIAVLVVGRSASGGQRWLSLGSFSFQPSELIKLAVVIYFAQWLARRGRRIQFLGEGLLPFAVVLCSVLTGILLENDLGSSLVIALTALAMFHAAGARAGHLLVSVVIGAFVYLVVIAATSFRRDRFVAFIHPLPPGCGSTASYQVCQGLISLGSGGVIGRGLGDGVQKAGFLPNPYTDGIFAVTGEELGLLGCIIIILLFAVIAYRGLQIAPPCRRHVWIAASLWNHLLDTCAGCHQFGSVVDLIPYTGVPLPLISFGGSSLITTLAALGILLNISRYAKISVDD